MSQQEETTFLSENGIRVTNARFILPQQTFAMSGITSVRNREDKPSRLWPIIFLLVGVILLINGKEAWIPALSLLAIGVLWLKLQKSTFHVVLQTASGESSALSSKNGEWISRVVHALNDSIIHRG